jgi:hypothetical protein
LAIAKAAAIRLDINPDNPKFHTTTGGLCDDERVEDFLHLVRRISNKEQKAFVLKTPASNQIA